MRRDGKTTRLIDAAVQALFADGEIYILTNKGVDAVDDGGRIRGLPEATPFFVDPDYSQGNMAQRDFYNRLVSRLSNEHRGQFETKSTSDYFRISIETN